MMTRVPRSSPWLNRSVLGAGITSALGDVTYESANAILPSFFAVLGIPPVSLGAIEGTADALASFSKLGAGYVADRLGHRKALVAVGYALTAVMVGSFALAHGVAGVLVARVVGWCGRGLRGPLRDAILVQAVTAETRGRVFGFHRAMDSVGAIIGPLIGVSLLAAAQRAIGPGGAVPFRFVFWLMVIPGALSVFTFWRLVDDPHASPNPSARFWATLKDLPAGFRRYLSAVGVFGLGDFAHTLLILAATEMLTPRFGMARAAAIAGMLYVLRNTVQTIASYPIGVLADRLGHHRLLLAGYALGACTAGMMAVLFIVATDRIVPLAVVFSLAGTYMAIQDALEPTIAAKYLTAGSHALGYGVLGSVNGVGDFLSSMLVGTVWTVGSPEMAFASAAFLMVAGTVWLQRMGRG